MKRILLILLWVLAANYNYGQTSIKGQYKSFNEFYDMLAKNSTLKWNDYKLTDTLTTEINSGRDTVEEIFSFNVVDFKLKYFTKKDKSFYPVFYETSYFSLNDKKLQIDSTNAYSGLVLYSASTANLNGTDFLIINGYVKNCNGTICRAQVDNFFEIKADKINFSIIEGWQFPENIYCDINNDGQLDQICFIGSCSQLIKNGKNETQEKYFFCVQLFTLKNHQWEPLTDKANKPYYIYFQSDNYTNLDTFKILDFNWISEL